MRLGRILDNYTAQGFDAVKTSNLEFVEFCCNNAKEADELIAAKNKILAESARTGVAVSCVGRWNHSVQENGTINWEKAEANLKGEGYKISNYVTELNGYNGVTKSMSASYSEKESGSLSDYVNAEKEIINFVKFDTEENAELAYEIFCAKFGDKYDKYGVVGDIVYFGTSDALDIATTIEK